MVDRKAELRDRIEAKKRAIEARLLKLRAQSRGAVNDEVERLEDKLRALKKTMKGGWSRLSDAVAGKLSAWLKD
jgi:hypothetical protein